MVFHGPLCLALQLVGWVALVVWWLHRQGWMSRFAVATLTLSAIGLALMMLDTHPGKHDGSLSAGFSLACWIILAFRITDPEPKLSPVVSQSAQQ